jgi:hypothetical protein
MTDIEGKTYRDVRMGKGGELKMPLVFQPFVAETLAAFEYLIIDYGFHVSVPEASGSEAWAMYENPTTRVTVHYELGAEPWVEIGRLEPHDGKLVQSGSVGLDLLLRERGRPLGDEVNPPRDIGKSEISNMLGARAERLRMCGDDLLRGDFQSFPRLQTKAEKELRRRDAELFGSES